MTAIREPSKTQSPSAQSVWTDADCLSLPDDGHRYELVNGVLKERGNAGAKHGYVAIVLSSAMFAVVSTQKLGILLDSSTAFALKSGNRRSPDLSFIAKERLQGLTELPDGFLEGSPDLAVEILSPTNTVEEIHDKLVEYFENGTKLAWIIHPNEHYILVYRCAREPERLLKSTDFLEGEDLIPGFSFPVADLFQPLTF